MVDSAGSSEVQTLPRVVIVGAGFGGLQAALALEDAPVQLTVIDRTNHHLFQPLLYQVATAGLSPADIAAPIRHVLSRSRSTEVLMAEVIGVDTARRCVLLSDREVPYDYLVLATGSHYNYFGHPEWQQHAPCLKSLADATSIRRDVLLAFEAAELEPDPEERRALTTLVLVGAGPTGVEMAGALAELAHRALADEFRHVDPRTARIILLEAAPRILLQFPESLADNARRMLERMGVEVRSGAAVESVDADGVVIAGERIRSRNVIWTAGVLASPAGQWLGADVDRSGRVRVASDLSVPGHPETFVIGDSAYLEQDGKQLPGLAPVAMQQGRYVAGLIHARVSGSAAAAPFHYVDKGNLATVGRSYAILALGKLQLSGFIAWVLWLVVHIYYLIGFRNRLIVMFQWAWAYFTAQRAVRLITTMSLPPRIRHPRTNASEEV